MITFIVTDADGRILQVGHNRDATHEELDVMYSPNLVLEIAELKSGEYYATRYVSQPGTPQAELVDRTPLGASWDTMTILDQRRETATLSGLPVPCVVQVDGSPVPVTDGSFEFDAIAHGTYLIVVDHPAHLVGTWEIEVTQ